MERERREQLIRRVLGDQAVVLNPDREDRERLSQLVQLKRHLRVLMEQRARCAEEVPRNLHTSTSTILVNNSVTTTMYAYYVQRDPAGVLRADSAIDQVLCEYLLLTGG